MHRLALLALVALAAVTPVRADVVVLKDGRQIEGVVTDEGESLVVIRRLGAVRVAREDVLRVEVRETPEQELARRTLALQPGDHAAALDLGRFCVAQGFSEEARALAAHVQREAPGFDGLAALWLALDFHLVEGAWVAPEVYYPANGWERLNGRWAPPEEVRVVRASRGRRDAERALEAARSELARAERRSTQVEAGLDRARADVDRLEAAGPAIEAARGRPALRRGHRARGAPALRRLGRRRAAGRLRLGDAARAPVEHLLALRRRRRPRAPRPRRGAAAGAAGRGRRRAEVDLAAAADGLRAARDALEAAEEHRADAELELALAKAAREVMQQGR